VNGEAIHFNPVDRALDTEVTRRPPRHVISW
jgi:hypothetical protein